jgi:hypothetical protein
MYDWRPEGVCCSMTLAELAASPPALEPTEHRDSAQGAA